MRGIMFQYIGWWGGGLNLCCTLHSIKRKMMKHLFSANKFDIGPQMKRCTKCLTASHMAPAKWRFVRG